MLRSRPNRADSIYMHLEFWRHGTLKQHQQVAAAVGQAHKTAAENRELVRRHPDLAEKLTKALGYAHFEQWSGYCPPTLGTTRSGFVYNGSERREAIVDVLTEAAARELPTIHPRHPKD